eukprot:snap_masked-scaffold_48-processed-gene-0.23-mRNA-1 protein AED:1.00 eAED:1.00 QI:0/-1/0/0/-1/1/1/0/263
MKVLKFVLFLLVAGLHGGFSLASMNKLKAKLVTESKATGFVGFIRAFVSRDLIQHNCSFVDGRRSWVRAVRDGRYEYVDVIRAIEEDDLVVLHVDYNTHITFEVFRFNNGLIVEHWDNWQAAVPAELSANGNNMIDGPTRVRRANETASLEAASRAYLGVLERSGDPAAVEEMREFFGDPYIQHNPSLPNGFDGLAALLGSTYFPAVKIFSVTEGNFVFFAMDFSAVGFNAFDLFLIQDSLPVEHWDTFEPVATDCKHENGKF